MTHLSLKTFLRGLRRNKSSFLLNLLSLTLGISCFLFTLLFVFYERSYDQYHTRRDRICRLATDIHSGGVETKIALTAGELCEQLPEKFPEIERMVRFCQFDGRTGFRWKPQNPLIPIKSLYYTDENIFSTFSYRLKEGNARTALSSPNCIVLTETLKRSIFGKANAIGQTLTENGKPLMVTGVLADLPGNSDLSFEALISLKTLKPEYANDWVYVYILFRSPAAMQAFAPKMDTLAKKHINPQLDPDGKSSLSFILQPLSTLHFSTLRERDTPKGNPMYVDIFLVTGILILLIACTNSINLTIVHSFSRVTDVTIRKIYGAGRTRLVIQHTLESLFVGVLATLLSFVLVRLLLPAFASAVDRSMGVGDVFNWKVMASAIGALVLLGAGGAVYAGIYHRRVDLTDALRSKYGKVAGLRIVPRLMLGFQFFITLGMSIAAISVYRQVHYFRSAPLGYNPDNVLIVNLPQIEEAASGKRYLRNILDHDPNIVMTAGCSESALPGKGVDIDVMRYREHGVFVKKTVYHINVDAHYLALLQIPVIQGDDFRDVKDSALKNSVLVTSGFAQKAGWPHPIGETFVTGDWKARVIGVVPEFHYNSLHHAIQPLVIVQQGDAPDYLLVRVGQARMAAVLKTLETHWAKTFPELPLIYSFLDEQLMQQYRDEYNLLSLLLSLSVLMIAISCIGLVAYVAFLLRMARASIAIRRVVGASIYDIYGLFVRQFILLLLIAFAVAGPLAWWLSGAWLRQFAYHVSPQPADLVGTLAAMGIVVGLIVLRFSVQGARANPGRVLREN